MRLVMYLTLLFAALIVGVRSRSSFIQPPNPGLKGDYSNNPFYKVGDTIPVQWTADYKNADLLLWQEFSRATVTQSGHVFIEDNTTVKSLTWTVDIANDDFSTNIPQGENAVFFFAVYQAGHSSWDMFSHYFNVSKGDTETPSVTSAVAGSIASPTAPASNPASGPDSGLSNGAIAGISVGATLGAVLLLGGLGFLAWRRFRKGDAMGQPTPGQQSAPPQEKSKAELPAEEVQTDVQNSKELPEMA